MEQSPHDVHLPNNDNIVIRWGNDGKISTSFANWIPPNDICPPPAAACPTKISKGIQHPKENLGTSFYTFEFNDMMWITNNNMPSNHKPTTDDISTTKSHGGSDGNGNQKPTPQWQLKSPASGHPSAPMEQKCTSQWQLKSPALGHPSAPMEQKSTPQWQLKSPALGQPSTLMAMNEISTPQWQAKSPALGQPSVPMVNQSSPEWNPAMPAPTAMQLMLMAPIPMPKWSHSPSSPSADDKTWPTNLIKIILAIKRTPLLTSDST